MDSIAERFDGIIVLFLWHAMYYGYTLKSSYPVSEKLFYNLTCHVIPQFASVNGNAGKTKIEAPIAENPVSGRSWKGTGASCGVDSMTAIYEYAELMKLDSYKIDHLAMFKCGQHGEALNRYDEAAEEKHFQGNLKLTDRFSRSVKMPLLVGKSNLNDVYTRAFGYVGTKNTFLYRSIGSVLLLQKQFSRYYFATGSQNLLNASLNLTDDCIHYERWLVPLLGNGKVEFYSANKAMTRVHKISLIRHFEPTRKYLSVCWRSTKNCGYCEKCVRTLTAMDAIGCLEEYRDVFDLAEYQKRRRIYRTYVSIKARQKNAYYMEIDSLMRKGKIKDPSPLETGQFLLHKLKDRRYPFIKNFNGS